MFCLNPSGTILNNAENDFFFQNKQTKKYLLGSGSVSKKMHNHYTAITTQVLVT